MRILEHVPLSSYTTFRIGGPARYFCAVTSSAEAIEALRYAQEHSLPIHVLGDGSNVLVSDRGFDGLVIKNEIKGIEVTDEDEHHVIVRVGAGENWDAFVGAMVARGYGGVENLSLIPGTVGAAPIQNIGAYGVEVKDTIISVETLSTTSHEERVFSPHECQFSYRESVFKQKGGYLITHVSLRLSKHPQLNISYKDLADFFSKKGPLDSPSSTPTIQGVRDAVIEIRRTKLPDIAVSGTAGSFFKNPIVSITQYRALKEKYPKLPSFPTGDDMVKIPLAWILDHICGLKGVMRGPIGVYKNQALVIINTGGGSAREVALLAQEMIASVKKHTGIDVEPEVQYVGF